MVEDFVADNELLYRCIFYRTTDGAKLYQIEDNKAVVSSQAFRDSSSAPSVDRALLCGHNPIHTQKNPEDGVVSLICQEVRLIDSVVQKSLKGKEEFTYKIDVLPRPLPDNYAHAQIEPTPTYQSKSVFRKLLERLAFLANQRDWEILPWEVRQHKS
ncbi:MAG: hypothetical protein HC840_11310 [Leptolyngbyaceae cyanobacterium RM2_2_4]|nr:hypothetical protein [Leptolyngbyaceae cyanobacterium SM1_4_3]NJN90324.1 hypothetical protein [Leptolyngbyaceae cyanobacterium SL_5_14]NJO49922.1 hypothetical protein [Leptolyngbyaceae cyanobacterium RM2_2_4]